MSFKQSLGLSFVMDSSAGPSSVCFGTLLSLTARRRRVAMECDQPRDTVMPNLLRLTYISRAVSTFHDGELDLLLRNARERNKEFDVTGLLCSGRGYFLQALEGPESNVLALYTKILLDSRHVNSELLSIGLVRDRVVLTMANGPRRRPGSRRRCATEAASPSTTRHRHVQTREDAASHARCLAKGGLTGCGIQRSA